MFEKREYRTRNRVAMYIATGGIALTSILSTIEDVAEEGIDQLMGDVPIAIAATTAVYMAGRTFLGHKPAQ
jgi:hypothetical protein